MGITFYYGLNASFKTKTLYKILREYQNNGYKVASNLKTEEYSLFDTNIKSRDIISDTLLWDIYLEKSYASSRLLSKFAKLTVESLVYRADILVLDDLEALYTEPQLYYVFLAIKKLINQFKHIYIATHSYIPIELFDDIAEFVICDRDSGNIPIDLDDDKMYDKLCKIVERGVKI